MKHPIRGDFDTAVTEAGVNVTFKPTNPVQPPPRPWALSTFFNSETVNRFSSSPFLELLGLSGSRHDF